MQTAPFEYYRAASTAEALDLLERVEGARVLAGGHSLLPAMKLRLSSPAALIDIGRIPGLTGIIRNGDTVTIGALTTHAEVERSEVLASACPMLAEAAGMIGDRQVRNRGTIGGSVAHADPAADYPTVLQAIGAVMTVLGRRGERMIPAADFFVDLFQTALGTGEIVTAVSLPVMEPSTGGAYVKHRHPASAYAVVGVAATVSMAAGTCSAAAISVGGVTRRPARADAAAASLVGTAPDEAAIRAAAGRVAAALSDPMGDLYASGEYRVHLATVLAGRALTTAVERAGG